MGNTKESLEKMIKSASLFFDQMEQIIFFKHIDYTYAGCNKNLVEFSRLNNPKNILYRTDYEMPWAEDTEFYRIIDEGIIKGNDAKVFMQVRVASGEKIAVTQRKTPVKDAQGNIVGIMAVMSEVSNPNFTEFLKQLNILDNQNIGISDTAKPKYKVESYAKYGLTGRESEVFFYLLRGMTTKMIARTLAISPRTAEKFADKVKNKLGCSYKSELIEKAIAEGLLRLIPPEIVDGKL